jgi:hypothetical protein
LKLFQVVDVWFREYDGAAGPPVQPAGWHDRCFQQRGPAPTLSRCLEEASMIARFLCYLRHHHNPVRHPLGGFKCADCGEAGADLEQMGFVDGGYVMPIRRVFSRDRGEFTRTGSWEPSAKGW